MKNNKYFAADEAEKTIATLYGKADDWFKSYVANRYLDKLKKSYCAYHGILDGEDHEISAVGEQGELMKINLNHFRNLATHTIRMITATRPSFQARSVNTDVKSTIQTTLANNLLDYYMRDKRLERRLKKAVEYAVVFGSGYIKMDWNATSGEVYDYIEPEPDLDEDGMPLTNEDGDYVDHDGNVKEPMPIYEGDVVFKNLTPFDVVLDGSKSDPDDHDWVICRTFKNKYDIARKYPEFADKIVNLETKSDMFGYSFFGSKFNETTDIPVYEFYHRKSEAIPEGRYLLYLENNIILDDTPLLYNEIPIYSLYSGTYLGTPFGYTTMFDILPIQEAMNMLHSTVLTNQNAFGVQNIWVPEGSNLNVNQLSGGLNILSGMPNSEPKPLNLTATPPEIFNYMKILESQGEILTAVNSVVRGNPEASLGRSGTALALVQSQALQYVSGLQQEYIQLIEDVGTGLVNLIKNFAKTPRIMAISGKTNKTEMREFRGDDLSGINRVIVDVGNPLANSTAGRVQIAEQLMQMKPEEFSIEQYMNVISTGKLENMTESLSNEYTLIKLENEKLVEGEQGEVMAIATDDHQLHIKEHKYVLNDPDLRKDNELVKKVLNHIQQHIDLLRNTDPQMLGMFGQQSLQPPPPPP